jgi:hypothetical protein
VVDLNVPPKRLAACRIGEECVAIIVIFIIIIVVLIVVVIKFVTAIGLLVIPVAPNFGNIIVVLIWVDKLDCRMGARAINCCSSWYAGSLQGPSAG